LSVFFIYSCHHFLCAQYGRSCAFERGSDWRHPQLRDSTHDLDGRITQSSSTIGRCPRHAANPGGTCPGRGRDFSSAQRLCEIYVLLGPPMVHSRKLLLALAGTVTSAGSTMSRCAGATSNCCSVAVDSAPDSGESFFNLAELRIYKFIALSAQSVVLSVSTIDDAIRFFICAANHFRFRDQTLL